MEARLQNCGWTWCCVLLAGCFATGCQTVGAPAGGLAAANTASSATPAAAATVPPVVVEMKPHKGETKSVSIPWSESLCAQDALRLSKGDRRFRRIKLQVVRPLAQGGMVKMDVRYDNSHDRVEPGFDYALQPGDRLVVMQDPSNLVDEMMKPVTGALSAMQH